MVEWKKLGEVANLVRGKVISKDFIRDNAGIYPVYSSQTANDGVLGYIDSYMFDGDFLTWTTDGAYAGTIFRRKGRFNITNVCGLIDIKDQRLLQDYLYYWLSLIAKSYVQEGMGNPKLMSNVASTILIPIPSLSEQQRIVSILDTFTSSISNLKQQIEERRKQYEYERDLLLDLEGKEGVEMKKLGECVLFITDGDHQPPPKSSEGIPFVTISDIEKLSHTIDFSNTFFVPQEYYNSLKSDKKAKKGDVLYTVTGSFGIPVLIEDNREFCFQRHIALIRPNNTIALSRYIYHWLCSNYAKKQGEEKASGGAQKTVSLNSLRSFRFYYPPLQAQSRIVSILDTFEQSISNLEEQLAMREKQYEYYRNQLLTFEGEEERGKT